MSDAVHATTPVGGDLDSTQEAPTQARGLRPLPVPAERPGAEASLLVKDGPDADTVYVIGDDTTLGRHTSCDIVLADITVSRRHASITHSADGYVVADLGSLNGTYVNGDRVDEAVLEPGAEVQIGKFRFTFR